MAIGCTTRPDDPLDLTTQQTMATMTKKLMMQPMTMTPISQALQDDDDDNNTDNNDDGGLIAASRTDEHADRQSGRSETDGGMDRLAEGQSDGKQTNNYNGQLGQEGRPWQAIVDLDVLVDVIHCNLLLC